MLPIKYYPGKNVWLLWQHIFQVSGRQVFNVHLLQWVFLSFQLLLTYLFMRKIVDGLKRSNKVSHAEFVDGKI
jgi:hypothetical protein